MTALRPLPAALRDLPALLGVLGRDGRVLNVPEAARPVTVAALSRLSTRRPIVVVVANPSEAEWLAHDLGELLGPDDVELFPAWETLPFERVSPSVETMGRREKVLHRLATPERQPAVVVAPVRAVLQRLVPAAPPLTVRPGDRCDPIEFINQLVALGYRREFQVEHRGEVALRGSIVDVFGSVAGDPVRIDMWGDEVDRLVTFDVETQRAGSPVDAVELFACREFRPGEEERHLARDLIATHPWGTEQWERLAEGQFFEGMESWMPWLSADDRPRVVLDEIGSTAQVIVVDPQRLQRRSDDLLREEEDLAGALATGWGADAADFPHLHVPFDEAMARTDAPVWTMTTLPASPDVATIATVGWPRQVGDGEGLVRQINSLVGEGGTVIATASGSAALDRVERVLGQAGVALQRADEVAVSGGKLKPGAWLVDSSLDRGFVLPEAKVGVLTDIDLSGRRASGRRPRPRSAAAQAFFEDLKPGDYVVHHHHGVAQYGGMATKTVGGVSRDYLTLTFKGSDKLFVPSDQIDAIRPYTGGSTPALSKMGGSDFARSKAKVRAQVAEIAQELVVLYQRRLASSGHAFAMDTPWQTEFESGFPFRETPDQLRAIAEVKADMEAERPMDRLLCGDVGFGKTEVALRAAFKAVQDGRQVAVLVPTTLLANQHFQTFSERFAPYPVRVEVLSRFLSAADARQVVRDLAEGTVDVVIGTHRLLSEDLAFARLGLLIVDEEQRFGVSHKEKIKKLSEGVDVLTLSATPIPRTLEMSLTGIRDLSMLHTAPADRHPILTYVGEFDDRAVSEAIRRELLREGQVFYVHNRVASIEERAAELAELVPEARICVAHGQMDEGSLERVVVDFWEGLYDVLVCTTIIESGIDMPAVNTLVVERADLLGLGQLHQIRGRVGRADQRAYAYLFHPRDVALSEDAYERLKTIGEATELGSGFRIAMRDLELRGAGNLLGTGQSGHIAAVGYDLYCQMVVEALAELSGEPVRPPAEIKIDVPLPAYLAADYIEREDVRVDAYRRLATVTSVADVDDVRAEWLDRFGPIPPPAENLLAVARLRAECVRTGVTEVTVTKNPGFGGPPLRGILSPVTLPVSRQMRLERMFRGSQYKSASSEVHLGLPAGDGVVTELLRAFTEMFPAEPAPAPS